MDTTAVLSIIATVVAIVSLIVNIAKLNEDERTRLQSLGRTLYSFFSWMFGFVALANGLLGTYLFYNGADLPTRKDIISLVLFLLNIVIGIGVLTAKLNHTSQTKQSKPSE